MSWDYWHRIEYFRLERGRRVLAFVEDISDHGFYVGRPERRKINAIACDYAEDVTEEFFDKHPYLCRPGQRWLVRVWRITARAGERTDKVCEVEVRVPGPHGGTPGHEQRQVLAMPGDDRVGHDRN
ncbi:hypothetical protein GCM10012275_00220 [Longimycelium tulufanense]|uniref:Uncharacterized protein n=1 Tax=Longimycelium tulufanense TaxID=907463 RepID=A0A8J3C912_9PSEU|nr:hypothetical protein [Longimycelium tulufanense]GGM32766.1 hypothetical protein GCM10012275_00220 [Longimycelium tulufanense]